MAGPEMAHERIAWGMNPPDSFTRPKTTSQTPPARMTVKGYASPTVDELGPCAMPVMIRANWKARKVRAISHGSATAAGTIGRVERGVTQRLLASIVAILAATISLIRAGVSGWSGEKRIVPLPLVS